MNESPIPRSVGTHNGTFHADEVTACALLILFGLVDRDQIYRTRDPEVLARCEFVCDVGGIYEPEEKAFDHHQSDYQGELSSAGMVLLYLKEKRCLTDADYKLLRRYLIMGIDAHDNGVEPPLPGVCTFSHVISNFTPIVYDAPEEQQNLAFQEALDFTLGHLRRMMERRRYQMSMRDVVDRRMREDKDCLMFDQPVPWLDLFFELGGERHSARFLVMPSGKHWKLRGIPPTFARRMEVRQPLPKEWAGLLAEDLRRVTGIPGAVFCHKGRFISVWETKEDALKALEYVLRRPNE